MKIMIFHTCSSHSNLAKVTCSTIRRILNAYQSSWISTKQLFVWWISENRVEFSFKRKTLTQQPNDQLWPFFITFWKILPTNSPPLEEQPYINICIISIARIKVCRSIARERLGGWACFRKIPVPLSTNLQKREVKTPTRICLASFTYNIKLKLIASFYFIFIIWCQHYIDFTSQVMITKLHSETASWKRRRTQSLQKILVF